MTFLPPLGSRSARSPGQAARCGRGRRTSGYRPFAELLEDRSLLSATIQGSVFEDLNGNGARDVGDPATAGVTVYLDQNQNAQLDAGEASTVTDAAGTYSFAGLAAG